MKKLLALLLSVIMIGSVCGVILTSAASDYTIISPYEDVVWEGEGAWGAYKGNLHSHTTWSDAYDDLPTMVKRYYELGFDFLANSDHGITGLEWNKKPQILISNYFSEIGKQFERLGDGEEWSYRTVLSDEEFEAITSGTYNNRGYGMTCITGANEFNTVAISKNHVNGYFLDSDVGNGFRGYFSKSGISEGPLNGLFNVFFSENEVGVENAVRFIDENGGLSHVNHPGDMINSTKHPEAVLDPYFVEFYGNLILKYNSCLGIEVLNERNNPTPYDRVLWDQLLMYCLPYGKTVIGFSNTDAHEILDCNTSFGVYMMKENTQDEVKKAMQSGSFFCVTRVHPGNDVYEIGPVEGFNLREDYNTPSPAFKSVTVDGHKVAVAAENADTIQWIANGKVIMKTEIGADPVVLNLDAIDGSEDFLYVRAEIFGPGGMALTQALVLDDGTPPLDLPAVKLDPAKTLYRLLRCTKVPYELIILLCRGVKAAKEFVINKIS